MRQRARSPLDLNALVADLVSVLQRLVGEDIEMVVTPSAERPKVEADPSRRRGPDAP